MTTHLTTQHKIIVLICSSLPVPMRTAIMAGIIEMADAAKLAICIEYRGEVLPPAPGSLLKPHSSLAWYQLKGMGPQRKNQANATAILNAWRGNGAHPKGATHYLMMVTAVDIYSGDDDNNFVLGLTNEPWGSVISTARLRNNNDLYTSTELVKTVVMHELGHGLGLVPSTRALAVERSLGLHCTNRCIMRQGMTATAWLPITQDRLDRGPLCTMCLSDLKRIHGK